MARYLTHNARTYTVFYEKGMSCPSVTIRTANKVDRNVSNPVTVANVLAHLAEIDHTEALEMDRQWNRNVKGNDQARLLAAATGFYVADCAAELIAEEGDYFEALRRLKYVKEAAHAEALELNDVFRKAKARFDHFWAANSYYQRREKIEVAHVKALEINRETPMFSQAADLLSERITDNNNEPLTEAETLQIAFYTKLNSAMREQAIADAHTQARPFNRLIGNADQLPEFWTKYNLTPADVDYIIAVSQRLNPELWASDLESAHVLALEENDDFDGIIRDGLTPEQRAIHNSRMGIDIYGEDFKVMVEDAHDEALAINYVLDAMPDGAGSLNGYVVQHAKGTFHKVCERNWTHNPLQASYFSPEDHQQGRMKQFCMNGETIVRLGDACRSVAGHAKSPIRQPYKKE